MPLRPWRQERPARTTQAQRRQRPKITDDVLDGWIVQDVRDGQALIESRKGGVFVVGPAPSFQALAALKRSSGRMANGSSSLRAG